MIIFLFPKDNIVEISVTEKIIILIKFLDSGSREFNERTQDIGPGKTKLELLLGIEDFFYWVIIIIFGWYMRCSVPLSREGIF